MPQGHICLQGDALVIVAGGDLDMQGFCAVVGELASNDDLRTVEVVGEEMLSDVLDGVLGVVDPYVGQQRRSYFIVESRTKEKLD